MTALIEQGSVRAAARALGCNRETVRKRLDDPIFSQALKAARAGMIGNIADELKAASLKAIETLTAALDDSEDSRAAIRAANAILEHAAKFSKLSEELW